MRKLILGLVLTAGLPLLADDPPARPLPSFRPGSVSDDRRAELAERMPEALNVRDFGAKGDGKTVENAAFERAFAAVRALNGRPAVLKVPAGDYLFETTAASHLSLSGLTNFVLRGESPEKVRFLCGTYDAGCVQIDRCENVWVRQSRAAAFAGGGLTRNCSLIGCKDIPLEGLLMSSCADSCICETGLYLEDCEFRGMGDDGVNTLVRGGFVCSQAGPDSFVHEMSPAVAAPGLLVQFMDPFSHRELDQATVGQGRIAATPTHFYLPNAWGVELTARVRMTEGGPQIFVNGDAVPLALKKGEVLVFRWTDE